MAALGIGLLIAVGSVLLSIILDGGELGALFNLPALVLVGGGTLGVAAICHSLGDVLRAATSALRHLGQAPPTPLAVVQLFVQLSERARREGLLALESVELNDPFIEAAVQMVVDAVDEAYLQEALALRIEGEQLAIEHSASVFETLGSYAPTLGIIGTVVGLIHVLANLSDPESVGPAIATAFTATLYGIGFANLICLPIAGRLKLVASQLYQARTLAVEGARALMQGQNPRLVERKLAGILYGHEPDSQAGGDGDGRRAEQEPSPA